MEPTMGSLDVAPDLSFVDGAGETRRLSEFWNRAPTVLIFLRHFG